MEKTRVRVKRPAMTSLIETTLCRDLTHEKQRLQRWEEQKRNAIKRLKEARDHLVYSRNSMIVQAQKVAEVKRSLRDRRPEFGRQASAQIMRLAKHKGIEYVGMRDGKLVIKTPLVFCDIRKESGSKKTKRACIGVFEFVLDPADYRIHVRNLLFQGHWAVNHGRPCLGEFDQEIQRLFSRGDYYGIYELLWLWLRGADLDAHAYMPSHRWREEYRRLDRWPRRLHVSLSQGDYVVFIRDDFDRRNLRGWIGRIETPSRGDDMVRVEFKRVFDDNVQRWHLPESYVQRISKEQYYAADRYIVTSSGTSTLHKLDALSDSVTVPEAVKMIKADLAQAIVLTPDLTTPSVRIASSEPLAIAVFGSDGSGLSATSTTSGIIPISLDDGTYDLSV